MVRAFCILGNCIKIITAKQKGSLISSIYSQFSGGDGKEVTPMGVQVAPLPISNPEDLIVCLVFSVDGTAWETVCYIQILNGSYWNFALCVVGFSIGVS